MGIVEDGDDVVVAADLEPARQVDHRAVDRTHAFHRREDLGPGLGALADAGDQALEGIQVVGIEGVERHAGHLDRVDDAGMAVLVVDDDVVAVHQAVDPAQVGHVAARQQHRVLMPRQRRQALLQVAMLLGVAGERRRAAAADAVGLDGLDDLLLDVGVVRQPEVAVGTEHQHLVERVSVEFAVLHAAIDRAETLAPHHVAVFQFLQVHRVLVGQTLLEGLAFQFDESSRVHLRFPSDEMYRRAQACKKP